MDPLPFDIRAGLRFALWSIPVFWAVVFLLGISIGIGFHALSCAWSLLTMHLLGAKK